MVPRQLEAELGGSGAAIGEQPLPKGRVDPGPGHHPGAVRRHPLLLGAPRRLGDELARLQALGFERGFDRGRTALDRRGRVDNVACLGHRRLPHGQGKPV